MCKNKNFVSRRIAGNAVYFIERFVFIILWVVAVVAVVFIVVAAAVEEMKAALMTLYRPI